MASPTPRLDWFPRLSARDDAHLLDQWRAARPTYRRGDELNGMAWKHDRHTHIIFPQATHAQFERAAHLLWRYDFYPPELMEHVSDFSRAGRTLREGDLIVQRIHAVPGLLDVLTAVRVSEVIDEPRRKGFAYVTTQAHFKIGEWWCWVERQLDGVLTVNIRSVSRPGPRLPGWQRGFARRLQQRAHREGLAHFAGLNLSTEVV
ncbi:MAG: DUF1990 domain-containing protein [Anaerolineales bacterium]|nr:DUF1990 domain-containing protein [Anaerolineales bacterium]